MHRFTPRARALLVLTTLAVAALAPLAPAAESLSVLLQKAIYAEETEGNLDSAIKLYEQIAAEGAPNQSVIAQAQYRLAVCYQKQGKKDQAIRLFNELSQPVGDAALARKARESLKEMGEAPETRLAIRKVPLPIISGWFWEMSRDGRFVSYAPGDSEDVAVCEIATGRSWTIFKGRKGKEEPWSLATFSPDGQSVALDVSNAQRSTFGNTIYVSKVDGTGLRKLYETDAKESVTNLGWSADGRRVIVKFWPRDENADRIVAALDAATGARTDLARVPNVGKKDGTSGLSPDARYLPRVKSTYPRKITIIDLQTGREESIVERDVGLLVGWAPGEPRLLFSKQGSAGPDLWAVPIKDGKAAGEPERLWSNSGFDPSAMVGVTQDGSLYCADRKKKTDPFELWVIEGVLSNRAPVTEKSRITAEIPPEELMGPNNSILDRKYGVSASVPKNWTIRSAERRATGGNLIAFDVAPRTPGASLVTLLYASTKPWDPSILSTSPLKDLGPKPNSPSEADSWLRQLARAYANAKTERLAADYKNRADSLTSREVNGRHALSWSADFTRENKAFTECYTAIVGEDVISLVWYQAPSTSIDGLRPALEQLIQTVRLP